MSPLIQQLLEILNVARLAPGTPAHAIPDLLRIQAARAILKDPAQATIPPGEIDPLIVEAILAGAAQAAALKAAGANLTFDEEDVPVGTTRIAEHATEVIGPFYVDPGRLVRVASYQSVTFRPVNVRMGGGGGVPVTEGELLMLIPQASTPDAPDNLNWTLPAGTVWIESRFLTAAAPGFTGLRIAGGKLQFAANPSFHGILLPQKGAVWTLSVQPEPLPPANTNGSDADALNLLLPAQLVVHSDKPPEMSGDLGISGIGSDLHLTQSGSVFLGANEICFSLQVAEPQWTISGNLSQLTQFSGEAAVGAVASGRWTLPITNTPPAQLGEARHSGSIIVVLGLGLTSRFFAQEGNPFRWSVATLTVNGAFVEIRSTVPESGARYDLGLWDTSLSEIRLAGLSRLVFRSERGGFDSVVAVGGSCVNKWDTPRRADGAPFEFNGSIDIFGFLSTLSGPLLTLSATAAGATGLAGYAFENLYLVVRPPGKLALVGLFDRGPLVPAGSASLLFDVNVAVPTLPDPYAANLGPPSVNAMVPSALRVALEWTGTQTPAIAAHLDKNVPFPEPRPSSLDDTDEINVYGTFRGHLSSQPEFLRMLDLSSREHLFGVAFESPSDNKPDIVDNRLSVHLNRVRLLLQPQVQWEPVRIEPILNVPTLVEEIAHSTLNGGLTLIGANSTKPVPVLPASLSFEILEAIQGHAPAAALFSLPFGIRAMANLDLFKFVPPGEGGIPPSTRTFPIEPAFGDLTSARQIRLSANPRFLGGRVMPGITRQLKNLAGNASGLTSVLPSELRDAFNAQFGTSIPLLQADLSGYGLSTFSEWSRPDAAGPAFTKVEFRVMNGRTAYEVVQFRSILYECGARVVRTVILERHNSGRVFRIDTGWVAVEEGAFTRPKPFEKGAVRSFRNIRRIRITGKPFNAGGASVEPVIFDADADIEGAPAGLVPIYDRPGYVHLQDPPGKLPAATELTEVQLKALFDMVHAIGSPANCAVRIGQTLDTQVSAIVSDVALDDKGGIGFAVAIVGAPKLPRAGQWTVVRVDSVTHETSAVDPRRGVPFVRNLGVNGPPVNGPFRFREPSETRLSNPRVEYALMMSTETSRALFQQPNIDPGKPGKLLFGVPPLLADPYSLVQSIGAFPRPNLGLPLKEIPSFNITDGNLWRIENATFSVLSPPLKDLMKGAGWGMTRDYLDGPITLNIDSGAPAPFNVETPISNLNLKLPKFPPPLDQILKISAKYQGMAGGVPQFSKPDLIFSGVLDKLKDSLDSLAKLLGIDFPFEVSVKAGTGPTPSFIVHMELLFRLGAGPDGRIDIGLGKFYGQFLLRGELEAALTGVERALLFMEFQGDVQQGILPPLLYGGGLFRFGIELRETGDPIIQVTLGIVISIGGDLIPGLLAVEATINYGYSLIPETLEPGILLGIEARAKLLAGLIGFSFSVEAMARIGRKPDNRLLVTIYAHILVAATVQVAIFFKEDVHLETQFQQDIPLGLVAVIPPATGIAVLAAAVPL